MKAGRVIDGDEHEARSTAQKLVDDAREQANQLIETAQEEATKLRNDVRVLASNILADARTEADRIAARAAGEAARLRDDAKALASKLVEDMRGETSPSITLPANEVHGRVDEVVGLVVRATIPGVSLGEIVKVDRRAREPLPAEVVGFRGEQAVLLPLGDLGGVAPAGHAWRTGDSLAIRCGDDLLGRVLDGLGEPIDGGSVLTGEPWPVDRAAPPALSRPPIAAPLATGVRA